MYSRAAKTKKAYKTLNFDKICRTCLAETTNFKSLFSVQSINEENLTLPELVFACTLLEISSSDGLPKQVCIQCVDLMLSSYSFRIQCHKSDSDLKNRLCKALLPRSKLNKLLNNPVKETLSSLNLNDSVTKTSLQNVESISSEQVTAGDNTIVVDNSEDKSQNKTVESLRFIELKPLEIPAENPLNPDLKIDELLNSTFSQNEILGGSLSDQIKTEDNSNGIDNLEDEFLNEHEKIKNKIISSELGEKIAEENSVNNEDFEIKIEFENHDILDNELETDYQIDRNNLITLKSETGSVGDDGSKQPLFPCEENDCVAMFNTENDLKCHHETDHYKPCKNMFSRDSNHLQEEKKHVCKECGKSFGGHSLLVRHVRVHTGEKPFKCEKCGKAYAQSCRLFDHMRGHSSEKNFSCGICGKAFATNASLWSHNKTHEMGNRNAECHVCGKMLSTRTSLRRHMKLHIGKTNFLCKYCGKSFTFPSHLKIHERMHTGKYLRKILCGPKSVQ